MEIKNIKYIGFDLDNTLIDRDFAFKKSVTKLLKQVSLFNDEILQSVLKKDNSGLIPRELLYEWLIEKLQLKDWNIADLFEFFAENMGNYLAPNTEVLSILHHLSEKYGLYLITNGSSKNQRSKLAHSGLDAIFSGNIFVSGELGYTKPQKEIFECAIKRLSITANETVYIGDNPETDICGANNCGIYSILIRKDYNRNETIHVADKIIDNILDIKDMFL